MTPEERNLVAELFDRLAALEDAPRDPEAERLIRDGLRQAPNAIYALVQTALVQDEALKRADARIQDLESQLGAGAEPPRSGSFLGSMRDSLTGRREPRAGSVPLVRPGEAPPTGTRPWGAGAPGGYAPGAQPMGQSTGPGPGTPGGAGGSGGSFLGTAAAAAAGMIGGSLLLSGIRSMMGGNQHAMGGFGNNPAAAAGGLDSSPWGSGNASGGNLARDAGLNDIGRSGAGRDDGSAGRSQGLFGSDNTQEAQKDDTQFADQDADQDEADQDFDDDLGDDGGDGGDE